MNSTRFPIVSSVLVVLALSITVAVAQDQATFSERLSIVPVDAVSSQSTSGEGEVTATLGSNNMLEVSGTFEGLSASATEAYVYEGQLQDITLAEPGNQAFELEVDNDTSGEFSGSFELSDEQVELLMGDGLYVMIHSEQNENGEIRGWLLQDDEGENEGEGDEGEGA